MLNIFKSNKAEQSAVDTCTLNAYLTSEAAVEGFFGLESAALWDCLLSHQASAGILGDMLEIGVYKGKSALMSSLHLRPNERFVMVDATDFMKEAELLLRPILKNRGTYIYKMSEELRHDRDLAASKFRWIHIDGDHTGKSVLNDLEICEPLLSDHGWLVLDDFFSPMYPQLTETVYAFLAANRAKLTLLIAGWNKAYLCRPLFAPVCRRFIVGQLASQLHRRGINHFSITKTSSIEECPTFGICGRLRDRDYYGLDANPEELPI